MLRRDFVVCGILILCLVLLWPVASGEVLNVCNDTQENLMGNECNVTVLAEVFGYQTNLATCHMVLFYPNGTMATGYNAMTNSNQDGLYYYPYEFQEEGYYRSIFTCIESGANGTTSVFYFATHNTSRDFLGDINDTVYQINASMRDDYEMTLYSAGRYATGATATLVVTLLRNNATMSGETLNITITLPDDTTSSGNMADEGSGIYSYDFPDTNQTGDYVWVVYLHPQILAGAAVFTVSDEVSDAESRIKDKIEDSEEDIEYKIEKETEVQKGLAIKINTFWDVWGLPVIVVVCIVIVIVIIVIGRLYHWRE